MATPEQKAEAKAKFDAELRAFVAELQPRVCTKDGQWAVKGFIDAYRSVYSISSDTKIVSKILEIQIFPLLKQFAQERGYVLHLAEHQNHYPDISFVSQDDEATRFAVDLKTTYRIPGRPDLCNGFTLGSHGAYFIDRESTKNIRFPYGSYAGHFCLGLIYDRAEAATIDETVVVTVDQLESISSVISNMQFFVAEKWRIAGDQRGSGNTANIGSIKCIDDILSGRGMFADLGEDWFDNYWIHYGVIQVPDAKGGLKKLTSLREFVEFRGGSIDQIIARRKKV